MAQERSSFGIKSKRVCLPTGIASATVVVKDGKITAIARYDQSDLGCPVIDAGDSVVMPGLVDSHVHVNEPGRTEWEGFETATKSAAAGGVTTIADMPLNSNPVTTTLEYLDEKLASARERLWVDCAFWGGVVPGNAKQLEAMIDRGVVGFKCFLIHSGIDDFPNVTESDLNEAMPILARRGVPLLVHAELESGDGGHDHHWGDDHGCYKSFLKSRPRLWENNAIELMVRLCRQYKGKVHIVHLSSSDALPLISSAKQEGLQFTVETCPHYLIFSAEEIPDADPRFKCAPPIREKENRERLWSAVKDGTVDIIVSDHSPCLPELKFLAEGDLKKAWGGISSLQFRLPAIWTEASKRGFRVEDLVTWMCLRPAEFLGLDSRKGRLAPGYDADIVIWDPERAFNIESSIIHHRHKVTPYEGRNLHGAVKTSFVRGQKVFDNGSLSERPLGELLLGKRVEIRQ
jgi:allantoinase